VGAREAWKRVRAAHFSHFAWRAGLSSYISRSGARDREVPRREFFGRAIRLPAGRRETLITTGLVMLMAVFASVFFILVDEALRVLVSLVLGFGRGG